MKACGCEGCRCRVVGAKACGCEGCECRVVGVKAAGAGLWV